MTLKAFAIVLLIAVPVRAQEPPPAPLQHTSTRPSGINPLVDQIDLTSTIWSDVLRDLPTSDNLFQVLETTQTSIISDRFSGGGLYGGQAARVGGFFGSSSQTLFRIGDVSITDPTGSGAPLAFPDLALWQGISVITGMLPLDANAAGLAIGLDPIAPGGSGWTRQLFASASHGPLASNAPSTAAPSIARLGGWTRASATAAGPLVKDRLGLAFTASWNRTSDFLRADTAAVPSEQGSAFANLMFWPSQRQEVQVIGWLQRTTAPSTLRRPLGLLDASTADQSGHAQVSWERHPEGAQQLRLFGAYTQRVRTPDALESPRIVFERLTDGPIEEIINAGPSTVRQWSTGARLLPPFGADRRFTFEAGADIVGSRVTRSSPFSGAVGELVNGLPARVWMFSQPGQDSRQGMLTASGYVEGRAQLDRRLLLSAGVAIDTVSGSADGSDANISWQTLLPRASARWSIASRLTAFGGFDRSAYRLPLDVLRIGDPFSPTADVYRWDAPAGTSPSLSTRGPLVALAGPGSGSSGGLNAIDPSLTRPYTDEFVVGLETQPIRDLTLRFAGMTRREHNLLGLVNTGVPASAYSVIAIPDIGIDIITSADDGLVSAFNRNPSSFGRDAYLLTNPEQDDSTSESFEVSVQLAKRNVLLFVGGSASRTDGPAANRGYGPLENDEALVGELFTTPNASSHARGRLFNDRAYTGKVIGVFRLPRQFTLGMLMRYQDGQPFGRVIVVPGLNQGAEAVRAYANGGSRFTFTGTLDVRLQKRFAAGRFNADIVFDAYNLPNMSNEVEEDIVTGAGFRTVTAVQPSRAFHLGLRLSF